MTFTAPALKVEVCFDTDPFPSYHTTVGGLATGYWRLDETSGNFADSSGGGNTATATGGGFTYNQTGALTGDSDAACTFGAASYATTTLTANATQLSLGWSFEAWVKRGTAPAAAGVVAGIKNNIALLINTAGKPVIQFVGTDTNTYSCTASSSVCDGKFHHVVASWNTAELRIWIDGLLACTPVAASLVPPNGNGNALGIGGYADGTSLLGSVTLDEVAFYRDTGITQTQAQNHYISNAVGVSPTWVDITTDVMSVSITRGRQWERGQVEAGTATVVLDDTARKYDPANAASVYYPNVLPLRRIRISATYSGTQYWLFTGYVERWPSTWENPDWAQVELTCVDGFEFLTQAGLDGYVKQQTSGQQIHQCLDIAAWYRDKRQLDTGQETLAAQMFPYDGSEQALSYIQEAEQSENGCFYIRGDGYAVFQDAHYRTTNSTSTTSQGTFGDADDESELLYTTLTPSYDKDRITNDMRVTLESGTYGPSDPTIYMSQDFTSIRRYFRRTDSLGSHLYNSADALARAQATTQVYAQPQQRFDQITITPLLNNALWLQALNRDISDLITVIRRPPGGGPALANDCFIEYIEWTIPEQGSAPWTLTWMLSPSYVSSTGSFVLDTSTLDGGDALTF